MPRAISLHMQVQKERDALQNPGAFPGLDLFSLLQQNAQLGLEHGNSDISSMFINFFEEEAKGVNVDYYS